MSYDIELRDAVTGEVLELDSAHHMRGGTYAIGGTAAAELNITYNYAKHYGVIGEKGIREIYGKTGAQSIPMLENAISVLGDDVHDDYWEPTEGNAKRALVQLLALAQMRPDGVWDGD
jgi:hypothetical protein